MKILFVGDIFGDSGMSFIRNRLNDIKKQLNIDFCIANGENSTHVGKGTSRENADDMLNYGVDIISGGNHSFDNPEINQLFDENYPIVRPANYPPFSAGKGYCTRHCVGKSITVISLAGRVFMNDLDCPFRNISGLIKHIESDITIVDFHAETTSEKMAMGFYLDGKVSAVLGTHTHVQTADERILPKGTAFITDVGMTGVENSILGIRKEIIIRKLTTCLPQKFEPAQGNATLHGVVLTFDNNTATNIERIRIN